MRTVYCIGLRGDCFLMVYNTKRGGWEMPGGKVEEGENDLEAAKREFLEESGRDILILDKMETENGAIFCGKVGKKNITGEMKSRFFDSLPKQLAFPSCEYTPLIAWARDVLSRDSA